MKTELSIPESIKREENMVFPQDLSESTMLSISHHENCLAALRKEALKITQAETEVDSDYKVECPECKGKTTVKVNEIFYCTHCGSKLLWYRETEEQKG